MIVKRGMLWALPLVIVLGGHWAARAQHVAGPIETHGWGPSGCASCARGPGLSPNLATALGARGTCRQRCPIFCRHPHHHCAEGPPQIRFRVGCPKPICPPCDNPFWGYYQTCWSPWPWPADWSHCPVPPPASQVVPPHTWAAEYLDHVQRIQGAPPTTPGVRPTAPAPGGQLPAPRRIQ